MALLWLECVQKQTDVTLLAAHKFSNKLLAPAVSVVTSINYHNYYQNVYEIFLLRDESINGLVFQYSQALVSL